MALVSMGSLMLVLLCPKRPDFGRYVQETPE